MIIVAGLSIFAAAVIKGITSFGFNLIAVSALLIFLSPKLIVPLITLLSVVSSFYMLMGLFRHVQVKRILPLIIGGIMGIPLGVYGLVVLKAEVIKILMGIIVTVFALLFASGFRRSIRQEKSAFLLLGLIAGVLSGSTSLGGSPVILFFINQDCDKTTFRANLTLFYVIQGAVSFLGFMKGDLITPEVIQYSIYLFIPMVLGIVLGMQLIHRVNENLFRQIALVVLIASGIASIYAGFVTFF